MADDFRQLKLTQSGRAQRCEAARSPIVYNDQFTLRGCQRRRTATCLGLGRRSSGSWSATR
jgi:hypothetical protein